MSGRHRLVISVPPDVGSGRQDRNFVDFSHSSDKMLFFFFFLNQKVMHFSYFSKKTHILGTHEKHLDEALLVGINLFLWRNKKMNFLVTFLARALLSTRLSLRKTSSVIQLLYTEF